MMEIDLISPVVRRLIKRQQDNRPKWAIKKLDENMLRGRNPCGNMDKGVGRYAEPGGKSRMVSENSKRNM